MQLRRLLLGLVGLTTLLPAVVAGQAAGVLGVVTERIPYGSAETSFGEIVVPAGKGPFPVAVLFHGGCWKSTQGNIDQMREIATMLAGRGIASWNVEYRRVGHAGGGWPGTFRDVADATDFVRELARTRPLDLQRVALVGHSSGGYFAAWSAGRHHLPPASPLTAPTPLRPAGLVLLDTFLDPRVIDSKDADGRLFCDEPLLSGLIGGAPEAVPHQLRQASPLALLPFGMRQEYVVSSLRYPVTPARPLGLAGGRTMLDVLDYPALAKAAGDQVTLEIVPDAGHFDFLRRDTNAWPAVEAALVRMFSRQLSDADLRSTVITMTRKGGGLFGLPDKTDIRQDASYSVSIAGDGTVTYIGRYGVRTIGRRTHKVPVASVRALVAEFDQGGFWSLNNRYDSVDAGDGLIRTVSDLTSATVVISMPGRTKSVYDYYGTPVIVKRLELRIDEVADSRRYTGRHPPGPDFSEFPVREVFRGTPAAPALATPEARRFRTQLSRQAAEGPNFAGFYTFARWGCGAGCVSSAIIDARTGQVWFPAFRVEDFITASGKVALHHGSGFQLDSDLVIAEGVINELGPGKAYFRWLDGKLQLIRFDRLK